MATRTSDEAYTTHQANKLPDNLSVKLYVGFGIGRWNENRIVVQEGGFSDQSEDFAVVELTSIEVDIHLPQVVVNIKERKLEYLRVQKDRILAENHMRVKEIDDKIAVVLALEYKPQVPQELDTEEQPF